MADGRQRGEELARVGAVPLAPAAPGALTSDVDHASAALFEGAARACIAAKLSACTKRGYSAELDRWLVFCRAHALDPCRATLTDATLFRDERRATVGPATTQRSLAALSSLYRALFRSGIVGGNPWHPAVLAWPKVSPEGMTPAVPAPVARAMIAAAEAAGATRDALLLHLLRATGLRRVSLLASRREHLDGRVLRTLVKGGALREVELPAPVANLAHVWRATLPPGPGPLFPGRQADRPLHLGALNEIVSRWARAAGASAPVSPHQFRAAFITAAYDLRLPEREIQQAAHHARPETTRRYDRGQRGGRVIDAVDAARRAVEAAEAATRGSGGTEPPDRR